MNKQLLAPLAAAALAGGLALSGCGGSTKATISSTVPATTATAAASTTTSSTSASSDSSTTAASGGSAGATTADGTSLSFGQTSTQPFQDSSGGSSNEKDITVTVNVAKPVMGSIADLASFDLDATAKTQVPWYVTGTFKNVGSSAIGDDDFNASLDAKDSTGSDAQDLIVSGFTKCADASDADMPLAAGATTTSCKVFLLPAGTTIGSVSFAGNLGDANTVTVTWK